MLENESWAVCVSARKLQSTSSHWPRLPGSSHLHVSALLKLQHVRRHCAKHAVLGPVEAAVKVLQWASCLTSGRVAHAAVTDATQSYFNKCWIESAGWLAGRVKAMLSLAHDLVVSLQHKMNQHKKGCTWSTCINS
jgi:hypothetical protein